MFQPSECHDHNVKKAGRKSCEYKIMPHEGGYCMCGYGSQKYEIKHQNCRGRHDPYRCAAECSDRECARSISSPQLHLWVPPPLSWPCAETRIRTPRPTDFYALGEATDEHTTCAIDTKGQRTEPYHGGGTPPAILGGHEYTRRQNLGGQSPWRCSVRAGQGQVSLSSSFSLSLSL